MEIKKGFGGNWGVAKMKNGEREVEKGSKYINAGVGFAIGNAKTATGWGPKTKNQEGLKNAT